jgi:hypothetical protein
VGFAQQPHHGRCACFCGASRADLRGGKLGIALAAIPYAVSTVNSIEGAVFLTTAIAWGRVCLQMMLAYLLVAPAWSWIFRPRGAVPAHPDPFQPRSFASPVWRFLVSDLSYLAVYLTTGMVIYPLVREFYATQAVPSLGKLAGLQLLVRGPIFIWVCLLLVRLLGMRRGAGALAVGLVFALVSGVAALLAPNPFFPDAVRCVHPGEVTTSNLVFGMIVGWLWGSPTAERVLLDRTA